LSERTSESSASAEVQVDALYLGGALDRLPVRANEIHGQHPGQVRELLPNRKLAKGAICHPD
jgi:hypothetical protein